MQEKKRKCKFISMMLSLMIVAAAMTGMWSAKTQAAAAGMTIYAIDLGAKNTGEATMLVSSDGKSLLVDSGDNKNRAVFEWLDNNGYKNKKFDTLVTHWHDDHAGNTAEIIQKYNVGTVYLPETGYLYEQNTSYFQYERGYFLRIKEAANKRGTKIVYLKKGKTINVGNSITGTVIYVNGSPASENWYNIQRFNNQSAAIMFTGGGSRLFCAGDIQEQAEKRILDSGYDISADIFKMSHHGYEKSNTHEFIKAVNPTYAWFTSHDANPTKYKPSTVNDCVTRMGWIANTFSTRYNGTLKFTCANGGITVSAQRNTCTMYRKLTNKSTGEIKDVKFVLNNACRSKVTEKMVDSSVYSQQQLNADGSIFTGEWKRNGEKWHLVDKNGVYAVATIAEKGGKKYLFDNGAFRFEKGWKTINGKKYYFGPHRYSGFKTINGTKYYFMDKNYSVYSSASDGAMMTGFKTISGKRYYFIDNRYAKYKSSMLGAVGRGWMVINGKTYYMNGGLIHKGFKTIGEDTYYFNISGIMLRGFQSITGARYYFGEDGKMCHGWQDIDGERYYFGEDGKMRRDCVEEIDSAMYRFDAKGRLLTGWQDIDGKKYCFDENGKMYVGLCEIDGAKYFFDENGMMCTGWQEYGDKTYYFDNGGKAVVGWLSLRKKKYYFDEDGSLAHGIREIDGNLYLFDDAGVPVADMDATCDGRRYRTNGEGIVVKEINCHLNKYGDPYVGWHNIDGLTYYAYDDGELATGIVEIDGTEYEFDTVKNGCALIEDATEPESAKENTVKKEPADEGVSGEQDEEPAGDTADTQDMADMPAAPAVEYEQTDEPAAEDMQEGYVEETVSEGMDDGLTEAENVTENVSAE